MKRCCEHGAVIGPLGDCATVDVLVEVGNERSRQAHLHGLNLLNESGTGPEVAWAAPLKRRTKEGAVDLEHALRVAYNLTEARGERVTWLQIALEEFAEVAREDDPTRLSEELVQLAAVCVSWAEKLRDPESILTRKSGS